MGTLRCTQWVEHDDTPPTSAVQGYEYNGVLFGQPLEIDGDPNTAEYDDSAFPTGIVELVDGEIIVTPDVEETV